MKPRVSLRAALDDALLLGGLIDGPSWLPWRSLLLAANGEALTEPERAFFQQLTKRDREPLAPVEEFCGVIGRRGGKSRAISVLASYCAALCDHPALVAGERGVLLIVAPDQRQADVTFNYIVANFEASPILRQLIEGQTVRTLRLTNRVTIEVRASDFRRLRGLTLVEVICDELAFFLSDNSANPDSQILASVRPGLATTNGQLFMISSPYARKGELWRSYQKHFGPQGDPLLLVAQATSRTMNATLPQSVVDRAMERDAASAAAEFGAEFRRDIEAFISIEAVQSVVSRGVYERSPVLGVDYSGFVDPSGGSADSFTLGIGHTDRSDWQKPIMEVDCLREVGAKMRQHSNLAKDTAEKVVKDIRRATRKQYSAEEKIRIVLEGLRGEDSIAELCRREGIAQNLYYRWSKDVLEAGKKRLAGDTARAATSDEVKDLRREATALKEVVADLTLENRLLKKSVTADGEDEA